MENCRVILETTEWAELWSELGAAFLQFADIGLEADTPDSEIWRVCQREELILVTANRNHDGPDSLGAMLDTENGPTCLPVFTVADQEALRLDK
jgi:Domain of unknown function (DUF5615)